ncbi:MAG: glutamine synthetase III [Oscillospiraceae bacterium]|jgi:glutamine synthetase|nr:glutamine synthetase III [Oscillospiraceae bacterium]
MNPLEGFGSLVFNNRVMQERLPREVYRRLRKTMEDGKSLESAVAGVVANAMKDWAIEKGVTHYTHWFQPMTGVTAEKHDSFIAPAEGGGVIMEFSGKELIQGEPDASSFPSGGLRATFEARGYTSWDPTSYAFIKDSTLCIPTAFCSYGGHALDKKTPLLRSMERLNAQASRVLRLLGGGVETRVIATVGPEQEYFLIDKDDYNARRDLRITGRTLFGAKPPKGQEMDDHYFGAIRPRVRTFMKDLNDELWKLGILAKTEHNETAPSQHELAPIFTTANIAADHNQLTMETMKRVADRHGLVCLLHEKPFEGVNGSGKHNNWSLQTDRGENLLEPGENPGQNVRFLVFLSAVLAAVDDYQDLLRCSVASAGNDCRLGADEAPPAIVSVFLGDEITAVLEAIDAGRDFSGGEKTTVGLGVHTMVRFARDSTDRNRTSPFAFTGNKFEFRSLGSSLSVSGPNFVLNTIAAESLCQIADELETGKDVSDVIRDTIRAHKRIIFNGNNYSKEWAEEAARRGLMNLPASVDAIAEFVSEKNVALFEKHAIFTGEEVCARYEILLESYCKTVRIEAQTMAEMSMREILPAALAYTERLASAGLRKKELLPGLECAAETDLAARVSAHSDALYKNTLSLEAEAAQAANPGFGVLQRAEFYRDRVLSAMRAVRASADALETLVAREYWPFPTYGDILYRV